jgi:hypothetical protein
VRRLPPSSSQSSFFSCELTLVALAASMTVRTVFLLFSSLVISHSSSGAQQGAMVHNVRYTTLFSVTPSSFGASVDIVHYWGG